MSTIPPPGSERADELLIQYALYGLSRSEQEEMDELVLQFKLAEDERFETTVAALDVGMSQQQPERIPEELRQRIISQASEHLDGDSESPQKVAGAVAPTPVVATAGSWTRREAGLALALGASLLFALASLAGVFDVQPSVAEQREQLMESGVSDLRKISWTPTEDVAAKNASGDVVWSDTRQQGYMRFQGLPVNDPQVNQYQLWIFDDARDEKLPVNGGVFNIDSQGEVLVEIDSRLPITRATMFAVTIEIPGGVVQSKRERLPLLAVVESSP